MPTYPKDGITSVGWLSVVLALRIRMIEKKYKSHYAFAKASGVSRGTLHAIKTGRSNFTLETIERLAIKLQIPVYELFSIQSDISLKCLSENGIDPEKVSEFLRDCDHSRTGDIDLRDYFPAICDRFSAESDAETIEEAQSSPIVR